MKKVIFNSIFCEFLPKQDRKEYLPLPSLRRVQKSIVVCPTSDLDSKAKSFEPNSLF